MHSKRRYACRILFGFALFGLAPAVFACTPSSSQACLTLTGVGSGNILGGAYVGPYVATINGVSTGVICDDYYDESNLGESWTATVNTLSNLNPTRFGNNTQGYNEVAWLSEQLIDPTIACPPQFSTCNSGNVRGDIQYAIWAVFDPSALGGVSGLNRTNAAAWLNYAQNNVNYGGMSFSNVAIYTPQWAGGNPPQEFILVKTPEAPIPVLLSMDLTIVGAIVFWSRRRRQSSR